MQKSFQQIYNEFIRFLPDDRLWSAKSNQDSSILGGFLKGYCLSLQWFFNELNNELEIFNPLSTNLQARQFWSEKLLQNGLFKNTSDLTFEIKRKEKTIEGFGDITNAVAESIGEAIGGTTLSIRTPTAQDIIDLNLQSYTDYEISNVIICEIELYGSAGFPYVFPFTLQDSGVVDLQYTFEKILPPYYTVYILPKRSAEPYLWGENDASLWGEDDGLPWGQQNYKP